MMVGQTIQHKAAAEIRRWGGVSVLAGLAVAAEFRRLMPGWNDKNGLLRHAKKQTMNTPELTWLRL